MQKALTSSRYFSHKIKPKWVGCARLLTTMPPQPPSFYMKYQKLLSKDDFSKKQTLVKIIIESQSTKENLSCISPISTSEYGISC